MEWAVDGSRGSIVFIRGDFHCLNFLFCNEDCAFILKCRAI